MAIITAMVKLMFAMAAGIWLYRQDILNAEVNTKLSALIIKVTCPCLILSSISGVSRENPEMVLKLFFAGILLYLLLPGIAFLLTQVLRIKKDVRGTYMSMLVFANCSFMGLPVVQALYGDAAIFYLTIFNMPYNILYFTLGQYWFKKDAETGQNKNEKKINAADFFSAGTIASVIALLIYFLNIRIPDLVYTSVGFVGNITTPLSMLIIGSSLATVSWKDIGEEKSIGWMLPVRLAILPLFTWAFMHLITTDTMLINVCTIGSGMPVGSLVAMGTAPYPKQNKLATIGVAASTLCSVITIPVMTILLGIGT